MWKKLWQRRKLEGYTRYTSSTIQNCGATHVFTYNSFLRYRYTVSINPIIMKASYPTLRIATFISGNRVCYLIQKRLLRRRLISCYSRFDRRQQFLFFYSSSGIFSSYARTLSRNYIWGLICPKSHPRCRFDASNYRIKMSCRHSY